MNCIRCGHSNRPGNRFCTYCGSRLSDQRGAPARLIVMSSPGAGREYTLPPEGFRIGRNTANDLVLDDEQVSGDHARFFYKEGVLWVEDLESTNGTHVNGRSITESASLKDEDLIRIGTMIFKFRILEPPTDETQ